MIWEKEPFTISTDKKDVDLEILHALLRSSYWAKDRTRTEIEASVANSVCFSLLREGSQIGFARVLTDQMAYAIILDMILASEFRGQGLGQWLMRCICDHPDIKPLRQVLWTGDADGFTVRLGSRRCHS